MSFKFSEWKREQEQIVSDKPVKRRKSKSRKHKPTLELPPLPDFLTREQWRGKKHQQRRKRARERYTLKQIDNSHYAIRRKAQFVHPDYPVDDRIVAINKDGSMSCEYCESFPCVHIFKVILKFQEE